MKPHLPEPSTPSISFSRATFAKLSPHSYLVAHLQPPASSTTTTVEESDPIRRPNGRLPRQLRTPHINSSSITHAQGSAVVRLGDTTAVCGIRAEILLASNIADLDIRDVRSVAQRLDLLVPNVEMATGCSPAFLPGQTSSVLGQNLSARIYALLHGSEMLKGGGLMISYQLPDEDGVVVLEPKAFWTLYIDVLFISLDGNPFDVAWMAVLAALRDVRLPFAYWDPDRELILCSDEVARSRRLDLRGLPVASTFLVFREKDRMQMREGQGTEGQYWVLADPDTLEEGLCDESVTITVDCSGGKSRILGISKAGGVALGRSEMRDIAEMAETRWEACRVVLETAEKT